MQDIEKWFGRWDARHLLHDASLDSSVNYAFLQFQCIMTWDKCGGSHFTHYTTHVTPNYKIIFFTERGNRTHRYMLEHISLSTIQTIASMRLSSRALWCETGRWGTSDESGRLCTLCPKQVRESEYHTLIQCSALWSYSTMLSTSLRPSPILAWIPLTTTMCTLDSNIHW